MKNARIIDIPYGTTEPIQYVGVLNAPLVAGSFVFPTAIQEFTPVVDLLSTNLYIIRSISFSVSITENQYQGALQATLPKFSLFMSGNGNTPIMASAFSLPSYYNDYAYTKAFYPRTAPNRLKYQLTGSITQTADLILAGVVSINAYLQILVEQIKDDKYVQSFKRQYSE